MVWVEELTDNYQERELVQYKKIELIKSNGLAGMMYE